MICISVCNKIVYVVITSGLGLVVNKLLLIFKLYLTIICLDFSQLYASGMMRDNQYDLIKNIPKSEIRYNRRLEILSKITTTAKNTLEYVQNINKEMDSAGQCNFLDGEYPNDITNYCIYRKNKKFITLQIDRIKSDIEKIKQQQNQLDNITPSSPLAYKPWMRQQNKTMLKLKKTALKEAQALLNNLNCLDEEKVMNLPVFENLEQVYYYLPNPWDKKFNQKEPVDIILRRQIVNKYSPSPEKIMADIKQIKRRFASAPLKKPELTQQSYQQDSHYMDDLEKLNRGVYLNEQKRIAVLLDFIENQEIAGMLAPTGKKVDQIKNNNHIIIPPSNDFGILLNHPALIETALKHTAKIANKLKLNPELAKKFTDQLKLASQLTHTKNPSSSLENPDLAFTFNYELQNKYAQSKPSDSEKEKYIKLLLNINDKSLKNLKDYQDIMLSYYQRKCRPNAYINNKHIIDKLISKPINWNNHFYFVDPVAIRVKSEKVLKNLAQQTSDLKKTLAQHEKILYPADMIEQQQQKLEDLQKSIDWIKISQPKLQAIYDELPNLSINFPMSKVRPNIVSEQKDPLFHTGKKVDLSYLYRTIPSKQLDSKACVGHTMGSNLERSHLAPNAIIPPTDVDEKELYYYLGVYDHLKINQKKAKQLGNIALLNKFEQALYPTRLNDKQAKQELAIKMDNGIHFDTVEVSDQVLGAAGITHTKQTSGATTFNSSVNIIASNGIASIDSLKNRIDQGETIAIMTNSAVRINFEEWYKMQPQLPGVPHTLEIVGHDILVDPYDLTEKEVFYVRDSFNNADQITKKVSAIDLALSIVGVMNLTNVKRIPAQ